LPQLRGSPTDAVPEDDPVLSVAVAFESESRLLPVLTPKVEKTKSVIVTAIES